MFRSTHNMIMAATMAAQERIEGEWLKLEAELRSQIDSQKQRVAELELALSQREAKIEKMELIMMPLSTAAGAAYVKSLRVASGESQKPPSAANLPAYKTQWQLMLEKNQRDIEAQDAAEKAAKSQPKVSN